MEFANSFYTADERLDIVTPRQPEDRTTMNKAISTEQTLVMQDKKHVWHHLTQHKPFESSDPMMIIKGEGMRVTDQNGVEYLDATSGGLWTVNVGYGREEMAQAVYQQLNKMPFFAGTAGSEPGARFAAALIEKMPGLSRVYYSNSGSEANEKAYKMVRQRAHFLNDGKKHKIIFRDRDYHGTTISTLSSTGQFERKNQFGPFTPGFIEMPNCCQYRNPGKDGAEHAQALEDLILAEGPENIGSVILEPITAGGGVIVPPEGYFPRIREICDKYDVLLHIDEVVCGLGRTGKWFGYQHFGITPDIVTTAKGVASGYAAISLTITSEEIFELFKAESSDRMHYYRDVSTFGGCTAGPAAALKNLEIIERENLLQHITETGGYLFDRLYELQDKYACIGDVRGKGFLAGLELVKDRETKAPVDEQFVMRVVADCLSQGVMIARTNRCFKENNNTLILSPAFICGRSEIDIIVAAIDKALSRVKL